VRAPRGLFFLLSFLPFPPPPDGLRSKRVQEGSRCRHARGFFPSPLMLGAKSSRTRKESRQLLSALRQFPPLFPFPFVSCNTAGGRYSRLSCQERNPLLGRCRWMFSPHVSIPSSFPRTDLGAESAAFERLSRSRFVDAIRKLAVSSISLFARAGLCCAEEIISETLVAEQTSSRPASSIFRLGMLRAVYLSSSFLSSLFPLTVRPFERRRGG